MSVFATSVSTEATSNAMIAPRSKMAEGEGFEPSRPFRVWRVSSALASSTRPAFRTVGYNNAEGKRLSVTLVITHFSMCHALNSTWQITNLEDITTTTASALYVAIMVVSTIRTASALSVAVVVVTTIHTASALSASAEEGSTFPIARAPIAKSVVDTARQLSKHLAQGTLSRLLYMQERRGDKPCECNVAQDRASAIKGT